MSQQYNFTLFGDNETLEMADRISLLFHPEVTGHYRKLACWFGDFDEFVYIDVDMLVLKNIDFYFDLLQYHDFATSCSNIQEAEPCFI